MCYYYELSSIDFILRWLFRNGTFLFRNVEEAYTSKFKLISVTNVDLHSPSDLSEFGRESFRLHSPPQWEKVSGLQIANS